MIYDAVSIVAWWHQFEIVRAEWAAELKQTTREQARAMSKMVTADVAACQQPEFITYNFLAVDLFACMCACVVLSAWI